MHSFKGYLLRLYEQWPCEMLEFIDITGGQDDEVKYDYLCTEMFNLQRNCI